MRIAVPDLISPSYFPAIAAVELGLARDEGLDLDLELLYPVTAAAAALREGKIDFLAGAAHAPVYASPGWLDLKLLCALSQNMYWFLVVRSDLGVGRNDLSALGGLRIGAAPGPDDGLRLLLEDAGQAGIRLQPVPGSDQPSVSFGVVAADALAQGKIDGFWANGMGAEVAVRRGTGTVVLDARRGDGPAAARSYTFPALMATDKMLAEHATEVAAVTRAVMRAQAVLRENPQRAAEVGERLFPPMEAGLIAELIRRDAPYYDPAISQEAVTALNAFAQRAGLQVNAAGYHDVVAQQAPSLWAQA
jgi:ABC-type nitrate/sulfonate/bicarbonate transport system substrate-binding protein